MQLLIDQLHSYSNAGEIEDCVVLFSFWQDTNERLSGKSCKGCLKFLSLVLIKTIKYGCKCYDIALQ